MKQHITQEQLGELNRKEKVKLREYWRPRKGDLVLETSWNNNLTKESEVHEEYVIQEVNEVSHPYRLITNVDGEMGEWTIDKERSLPLLSIGQMIEVLTEHTEETLGILEVHGCWSVGTWGFTSNGQILKNINGTENETSPGADYDLELCDALWEAVKHVLKEDDKA